MPSLNSIAKRTFLVLTGLLVQAASHSQAQTIPTDGKTHITNVAYLNSLVSPTTPQEQASPPVDLTLSNLNLNISKSVDKTTGKPGDELNYTITVQNPNGGDVQNALITDTLDGNLTFLGSDTPVSVNGQTLTFNISNIPAQSSYPIHIRALTSNASDSFSVQNTATTSLPGSPDVPAKTSNTVTTSLFDASLMVGKSVTPQVAKIGDKVSYTVTVKNTARQASFSDVLMVDTLPEGFTLDKSSVLVDGIPANVVSTSPFTVDLGEAAPSHLFTITYSGTINAKASGQNKVTNIVLATGTPETTVPMPAVSSPTADASVYLQRQGKGVLIGRVFYDLDHNGIYNEGKDVPISGARIMVAGIGSGITDLQGRYGINDLRSGQYGVKVQWRNLGGDPETKGGDYGLTGARLVDVYGLSTADFPIDPSVAVSNAVRSTKVFSDPSGVSIEKTTELAITDLPDQKKETQYHTTLNLKNTSNSDIDIEISDPAMHGAVLDSQNTLYKTALHLKAGEAKVLDYIQTLPAPIPSEQWMTDPNVTITKGGK